MAKRVKSRGRSARQGNSPAPYTKQNKRPFPYAGEARLANGELAKPANQQLSNKYR